MKKKMILLAAMLCAGPLASEKLSTEDQEFCQKRVERALKDCSVARRYFSAVMATRCIRETPEAPQRPRLYLSKEERRALVDKQVKLMDSAAQQPPGAPAPATFHLLDLNKADEEPMAL